MTDYRQEIRARMEALDWTQNDLAISSGVHPSILSRFFKGKQGLDVEQLGMIAKAIKAKPGDLLENSTDDPRVAELRPILEQIHGLNGSDRPAIIEALALNAKVLAQAFRKKPKKR